MKRSFLALSLILLLLPFSSINPGFTQYAFSQTANQELVDKIKGLDSELGTQFQLLNPVPMDDMQGTGRVWQKADESFTFSISVMKGDDSSKAAHFAESITNISKDSQKPITVGGHAGKVDAFSSYYDAYVTVFWGDGKNFYAIADFDTAIPEQIRGNKDQVAKFLDEQQKSELDIANKIDGVMAQHGMYGTEPATQIQDSNSQEITGKITSLNSNAILYVERSDGTSDQASVGMVLHKGDRVVSISNKDNPFSTIAEVDFGYGKLRVHPGSAFKINEAVLKDNLAKTQMILLQGSIEENIQKPIELKYHTDSIRSDFSVVTPTCMSSIRGSAMYVSYDNKTNTTTVYVTEDQAFVKGVSDSQEKSVSQNQKIIVAIDGVTSQPTSFKPTELLDSIPQATSVASNAIPTWIKNNAGWWSEGQISDNEFVKANEYLINNGIMKIPASKEGQAVSNVIPSWIKNNAGWWSKGQISDDDFVKGIQWLITNGIMTRGSNSGTTQSFQINMLSSQQNTSPLLQTQRTVQSSPSSQSANGFFKIGKSEYDYSANPAEMATISGKVNSPRGGNVVLTITHPDNSTDELNASVTNIGEFRTLVILGDSYMQGTYTINGIYQGSDLGSITFTVR